MKVKLEESAGAEGIFVVDGLYRGLLNGALYVYKGGANAIRIDDFQEASMTIAEHYERIWGTVTITFD